MLRGVNVGGHNKIKMDALRSHCEGLKFENIQTYVQSGNLVFTCKGHKPERTARLVEDAIEKQHGFRPAVILRNAAEMREVIVRNPFAKRKNLDPAKLAVIFFTDELTPDVRKQLEAIKVGPEELKAHPRELYIYFPDGMGRSKLPAAIERLMKKTGTARNWNTVTKLMEMANQIETQS